MATAPDFKAMVMESVRRSSADGRLPRRGEALLIGQAASGGLIRLRVPRVYRWFDALVVRGFIKQKALDRLGILIGDDYQYGKSSRFRLAIMDRGDAKARGVSSDRDLARLARAARQEWSGIRRPMFSMLGRPWPVALLAFVLSSEVVIGLLRVRWILAGAYSWLPMISSTAASAAFAAYLVLIAATVVALWRQTRLGYVLALVLAAVQFARPIILAIPVTRAGELDHWILWLAWSWAFPAVIWLGLGMLYQERRARASS
jgi:hypothetical protein